MGEKIGGYQILDHDPALWAVGREVELEQVLREFREGTRTYMDSETCGLNSIMVLLQWAVDRGPVHLYSIWKEPVWKTLRIIEAMCETEVILFNAEFDWFHIVKVYTIWSLLPRDWIPEEHIDEIAKVEYEGHLGPCVKPRAVLDLLVHSRKNEFQVLMKRNDIRIRKVPSRLAPALAIELENRVVLDDIFFAKSKDPSAPRWKVYDRKDPKTGEIDPRFRDVVLKFKPAGGLKYLAEYILKVKPSRQYDEIEVPRSETPPDSKLGYIPWALKMAPGGSSDCWKIYNNKGEHKGHAWPYWVKRHIDHWATHDPAREYAYYDVIYTRMLDDFFNNPEAGDDDSTLAAMVGVVRWRGYAIDVSAFKAAAEVSRAKVLASPVNINSPKEVRAYLLEALHDEEGAALDQSTKKAVLIDISKYEVPKSEDGKPCRKCKGAGCPRCDGKGFMDGSKPPKYNEYGGVSCGNHPAAARARELLDVKVAVKEVELYDKMIRAERFHPDFTVVGTLSTRMSGGSGGLNAQGIKHDKDTRKMFPLKDEDTVLSGGDFDSFEVVLAATVYNDPDLKDVLVRKVNHKNCPHGTQCEPCEGSGEAPTGGPCGFCKKPLVIADEIQKDENGETIFHSDGVYVCPTCGGKGKFRRKLHALFGTAMFPHATYDQVRASDGTADDMYTKGKSGVFGLIYGGDWTTLKKNFGLPEEVCKAAVAKFFDMFPGILKSRERVTRMFEMVYQYGRQIRFKQPESNYIESFLGFRRYFDLEIGIVQALHSIASKPPKEWLTPEMREVKVIRSIGRGVQTVGGATMSSVYGATWSLQASIVRAAGNHEIQSPGGQICKSVQRRIWDLQPHGVHPLRVSPMNIHDEIMVVCQPEYVDAVADRVVESVESYRDQVPLIGMTWNKQQDSWAGKKGGTETVKIQSPEMA